MPTLYDLPGPLEQVVGEVIAGRYRVDQCIGVGGMAIVFLGRHTALDRSVAIKILRPEYQSLAEVVARFDREARLASHLEHPNCIQVFDCGTTAAGFKYMVMPYLEGTELSRVIGIPVVPSQAVALTQQILRGLDYVHRCGIVHRDIKPDNVFVVHNHEDRETLRLVDFGVSKLLDESRHKDSIHTRAGLIVGTPTHMSPEQAMGLDADPRSDLYSVGIILYQMLVGRLPFDDEDPKALLRKQIKQIPPGLPATIPESLRSVTLQLIEKNPANRLESANDTIRALQAIAAQLSTDPRPWRPLLAKSAPVVPSPSVPPLGGGTVVSLIDNTSSSHNAPPSERSGVRALPTAEHLRPEARGTPEQPGDMSEALEQILEAEGSQSDMLVDLLDGMEGLDTGQGVSGSGARPLPQKPPTRSDRATQEGPAPFESLVPDFVDG